MPRGSPDLACLLHMEGLAVFVVLERGTLQVHAKLGGPDSCGIGARAPPDAVAQAFGMRFDAQQAGRVLEQRPRVGLRETLAAQHVEQNFGVASAHVGIALVLGRTVAKIAPSVDHLLGRSAADAELQASAGYEVGGAGILRHVERVLVAHVDDRRADFDAAGLGAHSSEQREGRGELAGEMVNAEIRTVETQLFGGDREINGLQERVGGRPRLRLGRGRPVSEREETDLLQGHDK
jgi:hypothetical protein